jgi:outer membrane protein insertion porin family
VAVRQKSKFPSLVQTSLKKKSLTTIALGCSSSKSPAMVAMLTAAIIGSSPLSVQAETKAIAEPILKKLSWKTNSQLELKDTSPININRDQLESKQNQDFLSQNPTISSSEEETPTTSSSEEGTPATSSSEEETPTTSSSEEETSTPSPTPDVTEQQPPEEARVLVGEVLVTGVEGELKDLIYNVISTEPGRTTTRSQLQEDVNAIYATGFFSNVKVSPEDTPLGVRITFNATSNPILTKVTVQTLPETTSESVLPPEIVEQTFSEQYGSILNLRDLQNGITEINQWYTDNGYDLAQVVGAPQISRDGTVTLIIAEGVLDDIKVRFFNEEDEETEGRTRDFIVTREIELKPGEVFNRKTAQTDLQRVFGLGIFEDVRLSFSPSEDPSKVIMNVDVVETNTGSLAAGAGISSTSGFFGTVSYQEQNLGGNKQILGTEFQLGERELLFDVSFTDPWIAGDPYRTSYTLNGFRRRSISLVYDGTDTTTIRTADGNDTPRVVRTGAGINFSRPLAPDPFTPAEWLLTAGFQYQHVQLENADGDIAPRSRPDLGFKKLAFNNSGIDDLFIVRLSASQDRRDNSLRPTSGSLLLLGMDQTLPITGVTFNRLRGSYSYYLPVDFINFDFSEGAETIAFNVQSGTVMGDLPPYEAFVLGGSNSVRGYGEGDLGNGRSYLQATAEYRFPIVSFLGGALFFDYGTDLGSGDAVPGDPSGVRGLNGSGYGYGLGVRVQSPVGPIRIDYAVNDEGDSRIHFGIGEKF